MCDANSGGSEFDGEDNRVDPNVAAELPEGSRVISTGRHGTSFWADIGRINIELADGEPVSLFIKVVSNEVGKNMVQGEFESMKAIYNVLPTFAPKPIAWGTYRDVPDKHFFLCEYREMTGKMPAPRAFARRLAEVHRASESPNGKFGFHITTYNGNLPQMTDWEESWEVFFAKSMRWALDMELEARGPDPEFDVLVPILFENVIPRLLRPLESEGRSVKPSLVHGDLWYANSGVDADTGKCFVFDACCFYAHNEYEFGQWRPSCNRFDDRYLKHYYRRSGVTVSEPVADYEGRLDLYKLKFNTHVSALFTHDLTLREQMLGDMRDLAQRYGPTTTKLDPESTNGDEKLLDIHNPKNNDIIPSADSRGAESVNGVQNGPDEAVDLLDCSDEPQSQLPERVLQAAQTEL